MTYTEQNKAIVKRFNKECIEQGSMASLKELLATDVINHSTAEGMPKGFESFNHFLNEVLQNGFSGLEVEICDQVAEGDLVATRKVIRGTHTGNLFGIAPTHKHVEIRVIDLIRLKDGLYAEHWGQSNFSEILAQLSKT
jgi:predicted ester cyclase